MKPATRRKKLVLLQNAGREEILQAQGMHLQQQQQKKPIKPVRNCQSHEGAEVQSCSRGRQTRQSLSALVKDLGVLWRTGKHFKQQDDTAGTAF